MLLSRAALTDTNLVFLQKLEKLGAEFLGEQKQDVSEFMAMSHDESHKLIKKYADATYVSHSDYIRFKAHIARCSGCQADLSSVFRGRTSSR